MHQCSVVIIVRVCKISDVKVVLQSLRLSLMYADGLNTKTPKGKEKKDRRCADMHVS
jgi:hypothetical protein